MIKKVALLLCVFFLFSSCRFQSQSKNNNVKESEHRAVWINFNELSMKEEQGGTEQSFRMKISIMLDEIKNYGLNAIIVHLRPFSDSFYSSSIFPTSSYLSGIQGQDIGYDPLKIIIEEATKRSIDVEAWINPYRVSYSNDFSNLADSNPAKQWYLENPDTENLMILENGIFYNPASLEVQKLILNGIREILDHYSISRIYLDDYFYPSTDEKIDCKSYQAYQNSGGDLALDEWRRENVNALISSIYVTVHNQSQHIDFVISPSADIEKNCNVLYADIKKWCSQSGFIDVIMPQIYFGFENEKFPFQKTATEWENIIINPNVRFEFAIGFYKCGKTDQYAGTGSEEWSNSFNVCARQLQYMRTKTSYSGFSIYSYSYLFQKNKTNFVEKEFTALKNML